MTDAQCIKADAHVLTRSWCSQVPYSEHSSFTELQEFVTWMRPRRVIPSVSNDGGRKMRQMLQLLGY